MKYLSIFTLILLCASFLNSAPLEIFDCNPDTTGVENVSTLSNITFHIRDTDPNGGVNENSIIVQIQDEIYSHTSANSQYIHFIPVNDLEYYIVIDPATNFAYGDTVSVSIDASDVNGVLMPTFEYSYRCIVDNLPPYSIASNPTARQLQVPVDTPIQFRVRDMEMGVDISTVTATVRYQNNSVTYGSNDTQNFQFSGTLDNFLCQVNMPDAFDFGDSVNVVINAEDLAGNQMIPYTYWFICFIDNVPPYTGEYTPDINSIDNPVNTNVSFNVYDQHSGIDLNELRIKINDNYYTHVSTSVSVNPLIGDNGYQVIINPINSFAFNDLIDVTIWAKDTHGNEMDSVAYQFQTIADDTPPYTGDWIPGNNAQNVPLSTNIQFNVYDLIAGVNPNSVVVTVNNDTTYTVTSTGVSYVQIPNGYRFTINPTVNFDYNELVQIEIQATDNNNNVMIPYDYSFRTIPDSNDPPILQLPDTFFVNEDDSLVVDFDVYTHDPDGDALVITVNQTPVHPNINVTINNNMVTFKPSFMNWIGTENVGFTINDGRDNTTGTVSITVLPVNDRPVIVLPDEFVFNENDNYQINFAQYIQDVDNSIGDFQLNASGNSDIHVSISNTVVTFSADPYWFGQEAITFTVFDDDTRLSSSDTVLVRVVNIVEEPMIDGPSSITLTEDTAQTFDFSYYITNNDNIPITLTQSNANEFTVDVSINGYQVTFTPAADYQGTRTIRFNLLDSNSNILDYDDIDIIVTPVNDPVRLNPAFQSYFEFTQGSSLNLDFSNLIMNPDEIPYEMELSVAGNENIIVNIDSLMVNISASETWSGQERLTFTIVGDEINGTDHWEFDKEIDIKVITTVQINPSFNDYFTFTEGTTFRTSFAGMVTNAENYALELTYTGNSFIQVDIDSLDVSFSAPDKWVGEEDITFKIAGTDLNSRADWEFEKVIRITVEPAAENLGEKVELQYRSITRNNGNQSDIYIYTEVDISKIKGKILSRRGKVIKDLNIQTLGDRKVTNWNTTDNDNNLVDGGFYIYQFKIDDKIYQGSIIVVR